MTQKLSFTRKLAEQQALSFLKGSSAGFNISSLFLKRGTLSTDNLANFMESYTEEEMNSSKFQNMLSEKEKHLFKILTRELFDSNDEEMVNMMIYILRKKIKNSLEMQFILNAFSQVKAFQAYPELFQPNRLKIAQINEFKHQFYEKQDTIFEFGQPGNLYYIILKGSVYCLTPNPNIQIGKQTKEEKQEMKKRQQQILKDLVQLKASQKKMGQNQNPSFKRRNSQGLIFDKSIPGPYEEKLTDIDEIRFLYQEYPTMYLAKIIQRGEGFGEIALMTQENRTATIVTREETHLMSLSRQGFDQILGQYNDFVTKEKLNFLSQFDFLHCAMRSQLINLLYEIKSIKPLLHQNIYQEGDQIEYLYLIVNGEVQLSRNLMDQVDDINNNDAGSGFSINKRFCYVTLSKFGYFGEEEIIKKKQQRDHFATAVTTDVEVYAIKKEKLKWVLGDYLFKQFGKQQKSKYEWQQELLDNNQHIESLNPNSKYGKYDSRVFEKIRQYQNQLYEQEREQEQLRIANYKVEKKYILNKKDNLPDVDTIFPARTRIQHKFQENRERTIKMFLRERHFEGLDVRQYQNEIDKKLNTNIPQQMIQKYSRTNLMLSRALNNLEHEKPAILPKAIYSTEQYIKQENQENYYSVKSILPQNLTQQNYYKPEQNQNTARESQQSASQNFQVQKKGLSQNAAKFLVQELKDNKKSLKIKMQEKQINQWSSRHIRNHSDNDQQKQFYLTFQHERNQSHTQFNNSQRKFFSSSVSNFFNNNNQNINQQLMTQNNCNSYGEFYNQNTFNNYKDFQPQVTNIRLKQLSQARRKPSLNKNFSGFNSQDSYVDLQTQYTQRSQHSGIQINSPGILSQPKNDLFSPLKPINDAFHFKFKTEGNEKGGIDLFMPREDLVIKEIDCNSQQF